MLMTYVAVDRYLRSHGKLGFVITESVFKTSGAGQGFRRFRLPDGTPFGPLAAEDMVSLMPFEKAANRTAILIVMKGKEVRFPISYSQWRKRHSGRGSAIGFDSPYESVTQEKITFRSLQAEPIAADDVTTAWFTGRPRGRRAVEKLRGGSKYTAREGANTGGANAVYWVDIVGKRPGDFVMVSNVIGRAKRKVPTIQAAMEEGLLYPLLRSGDQSRWLARPAVRIILAQDPETRRGRAAEVMERDYRRTHSYLMRFEELLRSRAAFRRYFRADDPCWSMFNIGQYTLSPWKVVWQRMGSRMQAVVCGKVDGKPIIPQETLCFVPVSTRIEAHYLCAMLNSAPFEYAVGSYSQKGGKSFASPHILEHLKIPERKTAGSAGSELAELSELAHQARRAEREDEVQEVEKRINRVAAGVWAISAEELRDMEESLEDN